MKKAVAIILACCMLMTVFVTAANAQDRGVSLEAAVAAVVDKLDPTVIDCLYNATGEGNYFEIQYHGATQSELLAQIGAIGSYELVNVDIGAGKVAVGLQYSSVVRVAGLDSVDYISLFTPTYSSKIAQSLQVKLNNMTYGDVIRVDIWIYRERLSDEEKDRLAREEAGLPMDLDFEHMTPEEFERYLTALSRIESEPETDVSKDFIEKYGLTEDEVNSHTFTSINANLSKARIMEFDTYPEVLGIYDINTIEPTDPSEPAENLIVLDNSGDTLSENVYICCHCTDPFTGEGSDIRAKMERMDNNEYEEHRYRFTTPKGTQSYYFTDGEKRTAEMPFTESVHLYLPGDLNEKGEYLVYDYLWAGGTDPVFTAGTSHTTFDRFYEEYITDFYEGDEDALWTDVFYLYDELFEHHDDSGDTDWVLLHVESFIQNEQIYQDTIGNRIVTKPGLSHPFESGYGIYDVRQDAFVPVYGGMVARYDGLAEAFDEFGEGELKPTYLYRERLKEYYNLGEFDGGWDTYQLMSYQELYYHRDNNGEIDWALIQCYCNIASPVDMSAVVGNRVLHPGTAYYPFETTYGIYDVKNDKFIDPSWSGKDYLGGKEAYKYDGFVRAFDEIVGSGMGESLADVDYRGKGRPLGDIDNDLDLSIVDVTMIQRCEAQIMEYPATDELWLTYDYNGEHYYSDFNLDGSRDIVDATCIQRYLADIPYAIG